MRLPGGEAPPAFQPQQALSALVLTLVMVLLALLLVLLTLLPHFEGVCYQQPQVPGVRVLHQMTPCMGRKHVQKARSKRNGAAVPQLV